MGNSGEPSPLAGIQSLLHWHSLCFLGRKVADSSPLLPQSEVGSHKPSLSLLEVVRSAQDKQAPLATFWGPGTETGAKPQGPQARNSCPRGLPASQKAIAQAKEAP